MMTHKTVLLSFRSLTRAAADRILFGCGLFLAVCELYKQLFLYFMIEKGRYDWWFFPFQLCSLPMYLCLILPWLSDRDHRTLCTFMLDFNLLGGAAALIVSEGFRHIHWSLTLHGYVWHLLLVLMGIFLWLAGLADLRPRGYLRSLPVFAAGCAIATAINLLAPGKGQADMFYISPYHPSTQLIISGLAQRLGILPSHLLYLLAVCLGGFLIHCLFGRLERRFFGPDPS